MSGPSSNFPAFLQARVSNICAKSDHIEHHHHHHLKQFQRPTAQAMATQQDAADFGFDDPDVAHNNDSFINHENLPCSSGAFMPIKGVQNFEDVSCNDPTVVSALTNVSQWQEMQQTSQGRLPFRPLLPAPVPRSIGNSSSANFRSDNMSIGCSFDSMASSFSGTFGGTYDSVNPSFTGPDSLQPLKIDTSVGPSTPPLGILSTPVDATQYEIVHDEEWVWSSTDYASSSHSSIRTDSTGPRTPLSPHAGGTTHSSYFSTGFSRSPGFGAIAKVEGPGTDMFPLTLPSSYLPNCQCTECVAPVTAHQLSDSWSTNNCQTSFLSQHSAYTPDPQADVTGTGLAIDFASHSYRVSRPLVPRQDSPPTTSSLVDLERQFSETAAEDLEDTESESEGPNVNDQAVNDATHRQKRDSFLLSMRRQNYSYKDIKELGNFREAESTLRGRVRVLTKDKSERVRKPEWDSNDISLLHRAFNRYARVDDDDDVKSRRRELPARIPWKKISSWMKTHGSSYPFAAATCARKWKTLN